MIEIHECGEGFEDYRVFYALVEVSNTPKESLDISIESRKVPEDDFVFVFRGDRIVSWRQVHSGILSALYAIKTGTNKMRNLRVETLSRISNSWAVRKYCLIFFTFMTGPTESEFFHSRR